MRPSTIRLLRDADEGGDDELPIFVHFADFLKGAMLLIPRPFEQWQFGNGTFGDGTFLVLMNWLSGFVSFRLWMKCMCELNMVIIGG